MEAVEVAALFPHVIQDRPHMRQLIMTWLASGWIAGVVPNMEVLTNFVKPVATISIIILPSDGLT